MQIIDLEARTQFINQLQLFARQSTHVNHGTGHLLVLVFFREHYGSRSIYLQKPSERKLHTSASNGPSARSVVDLQNISTEWRDYFSLMWGISKRLSL